MGAGASSSTLPAVVDKPTAQAWAGDKFDEAAFDATASDGAVSKEQLLLAAGKAVDDDGDLILSQSTAPKHDTQKLNEAMVAVAMSLAHDKRSNFLGAEVKDKTSTEEYFIQAWQALNAGA